jgi:hypothetical protein
LVPLSFQPGFPAIKDAAAGRTGINKFPTAPVHQISECGEKRPIRLPIALKTIYVELDIGPPTIRSMILTNFQ